MTQNITGTTIVGVRIGTSVAMSGDGQVTMGQTVMKHHAKMDPPVELAKRRRDCLSRWSISKRSTLHSLNIGHWAKELTCSQNLS